MAQDRRHIASGGSKERVQQWLSKFPDDQPVILVPVFNALDDVVECLDSILATTRGVPILVIDDCSIDPWVGTTLTSLARNGEFLFIQKPTNEGFVATVNDGFAWAAPRDVVLVNSDVVVPADWLERLRAAAYADSTTATATPFTNHGSILSVPHRNKPVAQIPRGFTVEEFDRRIRTASQRLYPRIPTAIGHCTYFRRTALTVVGGFDPIFSPGYGEEVDFSQRAVMAGMQHVAADDLFVYHKGSRSFDYDRDLVRMAQLRQMRATHEGHVVARYPWYHSWVRSVRRDRHGPLARALDTARMATLGKEILIDGTMIGDVVTGAQTAAVSLVRALCTTRPQDVRITLLVRDDMVERNLGGVETMVDALISMTAFRQDNDLFDLIHRPVQMDSQEQLQQFQRRGRRIVVTQLDFISFSNPSYYPHAIDWFRHRFGTQRVLASVDGVMFISSEARRNGQHLGINIPDDRSCVTYIGVDHDVEDNGIVSDAILALRDTPFIVVLGTDFRHKNRTYAVELLQVLIEHHHWPGVLVMAGPKVEFGSSMREEAVQRIDAPALRNRLRYFEHLTEAEKHWLLAEADLVLYPTTNEGFGLIPFEAAAVGTPTLCARVASLGEVLGSDICYLDMRDTVADATLVWRMLTNPACASEQVAHIRARGANFTWEHVASTTWGFYDTVLHLPPRSFVDQSAVTNELLDRTKRELAWQHRETEKLHNEYDRLETWARELEARAMCIDTVEERDVEVDASDIQIGMNGEMEKLRDQYRELEAWARALEASHMQTESWAQALSEEVLRYRRRSPKNLLRRLSVLRR